ncbi:MAG: sigma-70 family RNA polymerase sigma factor [Anaerolineales bacterium]|nr:sigma-70 family RNA polymerase sigma factor [Anaerolineales bacterium]
MKTYPDTETMLIATAQRGDLDAFNLLVLKYQDMMYRVSARITHNELSAEDATQNALIQAFNNIRSFRGGSFKSWLARVAINASYDELRREKRHIAMPLEQFNNEGEEIESPTWMMDLSAGPQELAESSEVQAALQHCIRALTPDYRLVVILVDIEGMSYEEAAQVARVPVGTVKSRLARARMQLRTALKKFESLLPSAYQVELPVSLYA